MPTKNPPQIEIANPRLKPCCYLDVHCERHGDFRVTEAEGPSDSHYPCPTCREPCVCEQVGRGWTAQALPVWHALAKAEEMTLLPAGDNAPVEAASAQPRTSAEICPPARIEEPKPARPEVTAPSENPKPSTFDLAAFLIRGKFGEEIKKGTEDIESAGRMAVANAEPRHKRSMLEQHMTQLGEAIIESLKKRCTDVGELAIAHPDKLGKLSPWQWARQQIEAELWGFFKLYTHASRLRRFIRRLSGPVDPAADPELDLWLNDEPAPDEPPPRLPWWLDSHQHPRGIFARHFTDRPEFELPAADDNAQPISPTDTDDFFRMQERFFRSKLEKALFDAEADLLVQSVRTPEQPAKPGSRDEKGHKPTTRLPKRGTDLSPLMDEATPPLTARQRECYSLRWEYGLEPPVIASRLRIDRATVHEHIDAAQKKIDFGRAKSKSQMNRAKSGGLDEDSTQ